MVTVFISDCFLGFCFALGFFFPEGLSTEFRLKVEWKNFSHSWNWMTQKIYWSDSPLPKTSILFPLSCGFGMICQCSIPTLFPELLHQPCQAVRDVAWAFTGGCAFLTGGGKPRGRSRNAMGSLHKPWGLEHIPKAHSWSLLETRYSLGRNLFWIRKQLFLYSSKIGSITALAVPNLQERGRTDFRTEMLRTLESTTQNLSHLKWLPEVTWV